MQRRKSGHGGHRGPPHAKYGDEPHVATEYEESTPNGASRNLLPYLRDTIGGINSTWAILVSVWIAVGSIAGPLIVAGWLITPAKETDMKIALTSISDIKSTHKEMLSAIVRLEEAGRGRDHMLDTLDRKVDRILDHEVWRFTPTPAAPAAISPSRSEQNKRQGSNDDNSLRAKENE